MNSEAKQVMIGRAELVGFPSIDNTTVYARIDTGARTSSIWASVTEVVEDSGSLRVVFFGPESDAYTGKEYYFTDYSHTIVASSNGQAEPRFKVKLALNIKGRKIRATFTLANRSTQVYPVLIGRNTLRGKFIVDVTKGAALKDKERARTLELRKKLENEKG